MKRLAIALPIMALFCPGVAQALPLYDNINQPVGGSVDVDPDNSVGPLADSFTTLNTDYVFNDLLIRVSGGAEGVGASLVVNLLNDNSGSPGSVKQQLATIDDADLSASLAVVEIDSFGNITLTHNTVYWIQLVTTRGGSSAWAYATTDAGTGVAGQSNFDSSGPSPNSQVTPYEMKVDQKSVPEPLTISLFGAGLAGAASLRRRKAK